MGVIHASSIIEPGAIIHDSVEIGPFCTIGAKVSLGEGTKLISHVHIQGKTKIGKFNQIYPFVSIGCPPQDLGYKNEETEVIIGDNNIFRESVSIHRATTKENLKTIIGDNNFFMTSVHIGHDCIIGSNCIMASACSVAGHTHIGDKTILSGTVALSQFTKVGEGVFVAGHTGIDKDLPPFCIAQGNRAIIRSLNLIGLKRRGLTREQVKLFNKLFNDIVISDLSPRKYFERPLSQELESIDEIRSFKKFILESKKGICPLEK